MKRNRLHHKLPRKRGRVLSCVLCAALLLGLGTVPAQGAEPTEAAEITETVQSESTEEAAGELLESEETAVQTSGTRYWNSVNEVLNTDDHKAYISGYENGFFLPNSNVTRAEAVQMFYSLLRNQPAEKKSFTDTASGWYKEAVESVAGLGVVGGYEDGTFRPNNKITRAEFVTIAVGFDSITQTESEFTDVPSTSWAAPYIATAAAKGWVSGYEDGTFRPNDNITRAEAVSILNKLLGRKVDVDIKEKTDAKNFYDVFPEHWAYGQILEAATDHVYYLDSLGERWLSYTQDKTEVESHWVTMNGKKYYVDAATRKLVRGEKIIDGETYVFDRTTGALKPSNGWKMVDGYRRYEKNGKLLEDISDMNLVSGPYMIKVYKPANYLIVYAKDSTGAYNTPVKAMRVSCGEATPTGTFYTPTRYRWLKMVGDTWAQWCTQIYGNYLFHSVPNWTKNNADLEVEEFNHLGDTRSLGCIRLNCEDAKWIYDNCALYTKVVISATETKGPLSKPAGITIPSWHTWDPTDPTAAGYCKQHGCH